ncbi:MAG: hypothetical protein PHG05_03490 [Candidatus Nanoarchaeia archaeon]|nr:hypothetical protein [Candidatus Nanoarchaeia archaeon]
MISGTDFLNPFIKLGNSIIEILPGIIAAIIIIIVGYLIGHLIGHAIKILLEKLGLDKRLEKAELSKAMGKFKISAVLGEIVKWYIFIVFLQAGAEILDLGGLSIILNEFVMWMPDLIAAVIIIFAGLIIAHGVYIKLIKNSNIIWTKQIAGILRITIIIVTVIIALGQIGIDVSFIQDLFLILAAAVGVGLALAIGLSFGLGSKEQASEILKKMKKK